MFDDVAVVDGYVPVRHLCYKMGLDPARQLQKVKQEYKTVFKTVLCKKANLKVVCISLEDAEDFIKKGGLWTRGAYKKGNSK